MQISNRKNEESKKKVVDKWKGAGILPQKKRSSRNN